MRLLVLCGLVALAGCAPKTPEKVADRFVDLYFVEIDQKRALGLASGLAKSKLEEELNLVETVRQTQSADQAKPSVFYSRRDAQVQGEHARLSYDITIKQGRDETQRHALISVEQTGGRWTVGNFMVAEGHLPARPAARP